MSEWRGRCGVSVWAYCLMPNHVHLVIIPEGEGGLRRAIGEANRRYTLQVNGREGWRGHIWQGRFAREGFVETLESALARPLEPGKRGRKPRGDMN